MESRLLLAWKGGAGGAGGAKAEAGTGEGNRSGIGARTGHIGK